MTEGYTVWLPFELPNRQEIGLEHALQRGEIVQGFPATLIREDTCYVIEAAGIPTLEAAYGLLKKLCTGLMWAALEARLGVRPRDAPLQDAKDGVIQTEFPAIYRSDQPVRRWSFAAAPPTSTHHPETFLNWVSTGAALPCSETLASDAKLALALELYCTAQFEATAAAKFLTLFTALEAAAPDKKGNHTDRTATYVRSALRANGDPGAKAAAEEVRKLYRVRSDLVHGRGPELGDAPSLLDEIMSRVLKAAMGQKGR